MTLVITSRKLISCSSTAVGSGDIYYLTLNNKSVFCLFYQLCCGENSLLAEEKTVGQDLRIAFFLHDRLEGKSLGY